MTNANTEITIDQLQTAITTNIAAQFPDLKTVALYDEDDRDGNPLPAVFVEVEDFEAYPDEDPGTEQTAVQLRISARIVIGFRTAKAKTEIRRLAAALAHFVNQNRWGLPVSPAEFLVAGPDDFDPGLDQFETWRVEWQQIVHLGTSVWESDDTTPTEILYSWRPEIGTAHEGDYQEATE
jgi:hypothetical protein